MQRISELGTSDADQKEFEQICSLVRRCVICDRDYTLSDSLGMLECLQHPGQPDWETGTWTCCGMPGPVRGNLKTWYDTSMPAHELGCVRCDHRETYAPLSRNNGVVAIALAYGRPIFNRAKIKYRDPEETHGIVSAFDVREYQKRMPMYQGLTTATERPPPPTPQQMLVSGERPFHQIPIYRIPFIDMLTEHK